MLAKYNGKEIYRSKQAVNFNYEHDEGRNTLVIFEFDEDADVIIEKGAYVRLEGTTFTALSCGGMMWPGINLLGTTNAAYNIDQNPPINGDQGYL